MELLGIAFVLLSIPFFAIATYRELAIHSLIIGNESQTIPFAIAIFMLIEGSRILLRVESEYLWFYALYYAILAVVSLFLGFLLSNLIGNYVYRRWRKNL